MLDRKLLTDAPDTIRAMCEARGTVVDLDALRALNDRRKSLQASFDQLRNEQKEASREIGVAKKSGRGGREVSELLAQMSQIAERVKALQNNMTRTAEALDAALLHVPNLLDATTPRGISAAENPVVRTWGTPRTFAFPIQDHVTLGESLGILDFARGAKLAGARFTLYRGRGARLERALINFMLDVQTRDHGYTEAMPPLLVNRATMTGTGQLPKFEADLFQTTDGLFLIPTAEVPLTNIFAGEILTADQCPVRLTAYTPCFRREAGSYGKDTKGLIRQHQFNKVELVSLTRPDDSAAELERMTTCAETILQRLELPYRVVQLCAGEIGFSAAKTYDLEVWLPGQSTYREISSCSNCTDFQARRAAIRFKDNDGTLRFVHTLNGSGLAVGRTLIALLENHQDADGNVHIPEALRPFFDHSPLLSRE
ncbi:MAG: serine--tRNA ligase [Deltaproteobacteria bacterium]|nr:serine--tRNA ligase [Deltaproteobacteria bacterium]